MRKTVVGLLVLLAGLCTSGVSTAEAVKNRGVATSVRASVSKLKPVAPTSVSPERRQIAKAAQAAKLRALRSAGASFGRSASLNRSQPDECEEAQMCTPEWEEEAFVYDFYSDLWEMLLEIEVLVSRLDTVTINGSSSCMVSVFTSFGSASMDCNDIENNMDLHDLGFDEYEREFLGEAIEATETKDLKKLAEKGLETWKRPCVINGESPNVYVSRAKVSCNAHVTDSLPSIGTLGQRVTAAQMACETQTADLFIDVATGSNLCPAPSAMGRR